MERITRKNGFLYYGGERCSSADDAYGKFREDYHRTVGKDANARLDRLGQRTETIHWKGCFYADGYFGSKCCFSGIQVESRIIGIVVTSYCRILNIPDDIPEEKEDEFIDWILDDGNRALRLVGRKNGLGRTNKRQNTNFR